MKFYAILRVQTGDAARWAAVVLTCCADHVPMSLTDWSKMPLSGRGALCLCCRKRMPVGPGVHITALGRRSR
ncbi:hypothetical protein BFP70_10675 [Thioclava sp. SK-1]|nr:hypothetical protein BFP70_10675 [Thioclava sp. SK-1]